MDIKPVLYIDLDNVVYNTIDVIKYMYDEDYRLYDRWVDVPVTDIKSYTFSELNLLTKEKLNEYFCSGRFFDLVSCIDGAELSIATLNGLSQFPVEFISMGTPENIKGKIQWVQNFNKGFGLNIEFNGVYDSFADKSHIDMSSGILIDDELKNLETSNAQMKICFGNYDWNKDWSGIRAENWEQVRKILYEEVKRRDDKSRD